MSKWIVKQQDENYIKKISAEFEVDPVIARLLYNRGLNSTEKIRHFFNTDLGNLHDPFLLEGMDKAVVRIKQAINNNEKITIYGDYDVDGITSVVVLYKYLSSQGIDVDYYIPDRAEEGYGLNENAVCLIKEKGTSLIITVDTGTTAVDEIKLANERGLDVIVTDHHECKQKIPECIAVVNPKREDSKYPYKELAGVGVVFKLVCALMGDSEQAFNLYGDLVAIGTIADIMPLIDENRILVLYGLSLIGKRPSLGIKALLEAVGVKAENISAGVVAYQIAPRLNAAGRIGNPASSVELLLSSDRDIANNISISLCDENRHRQQMEQEILNDVESMINTGGTKNNILIFASSQWHHGVIGIVASRIVERYNKPCILVCFEGNHAKGSARSIKGVSIFELLCSVSETLEKFGGHEMAAGLTLDRDKYESFIEAITSVANKKITDEMLIPVIEIECELSSEQLTLQLAKLLHKLEPFGTGNPTPNFLVRNLKIMDIISVGAGKHTKLILSSGETDVAAMYFGMKSSEGDFAIGDNVDIVCALTENIFRGTSSLTLNIKSIRLCEDELEEEQRMENLYADFINNKNIIDECRLKRIDITSFYKFLLRQSNAQVTSYNLHALARTLKTTIPDFNYCKLRLCLDIFRELKLVKIYENHATEIILHATKGKTDLSLSQTWTQCSIK
ncbi:MAG: single-stranded-DNA-specific exonuclease RecJ [Clostridiales bacterium]|nr:MAG: single-stranded-DNA-specific exonuclease RecJ [Clostridiales bacterium]